MSERGCPIRETIWVIGSYDLQALRLCVRQRVGELRLGRTPLRCHHLRCFVETNISLRKIQKHADMRFVIVA